MIGAPVFLYGTLLDPGVLARRSGDVRLARRRPVPARLAGSRRVALRGTAYPTLVADADAWVDGMLVRPAPSAMRRLVAYEGPAYRLVPLRVTVARGPRRARAWVARPWLAEPRRPWP